MTSQDIIIHIKCDFLSCRSIAKVTAEHQDDWDEFIDPVLFGIRTAIQESTHYTPFFLMYGREARFPLENEATEAVSSESQLGDVQCAVNRLQQMREKVFPNASRNISINQSKQREHYRRRKGLKHKVNIKKGDVVLRLNMLKRTKKGHKHEDTWIGPYRVLNISKYGCCTLSCIQTGKEMKKKVNLKQLKVYQEPQTTGADPPTAVPPDEGNAILN